MTKPSSSLPPALSYRARHLHLEEVSLDRLASETGTPAYVYSRARLIENYLAFLEAAWGC